MWMRVAGLAAALSCFFSLPAVGETDCGALRTTLEDARAALRDCLLAGRGCTEETAKRDAANAAWRACMENAPPPASPADPAAAGSGDGGGSKETGAVAIVVEGPERLHEAAEKGAREALEGLVVMDKGVVRAARAFLGPGELDAAASAKLRSELDAARLLLIEVKPEGTQVFVSVRASDARGETRRFLSSSASSLSADVKRMVSELPEAVVVSAPKTSPAPSPTPRPRLPVFDAGRDRSDPWIELHLAGGTKRMSEDDWGELSSHGTFGFLTSLGKGTWPVQVAADVILSRDRYQNDGLSFTGATTEVATGVRKTIGSEAFRPYLGGGLCYVTASSEVRGGGLEGSTGGVGVGLWGSVGGFLHLGTNFGAGVHLRFTSASVRMEDEPIAAGGLHAGVTLGFLMGTAARDSDRDD